MAYSVKTETPAGSIVRFFFNDTATTEIYTLSAAPSLSSTQDPAINTTGTGVNFGPTYMSLITNATDSPGVAGYLTYGASGIALVGNGTENDQRNAYVVRDSSFVSFLSSRASSVESTAYRFEGAQNCALISPNATGFTATNSRGIWTRSGSTSSLRNTMFGGSFAGFTTILDDTQNTFVALGTQEISGGRGLSYTGTLQVGTETQPTDTPKFYVSVYPGTTIPAELDMSTSLGAKWLRFTTESEANVRGAIEQVGGGLGIRGGTTASPAKIRLLSQTGFSTVTFSDGATGPSVINGNRFKTANTGATTITNFTQGTDGQLITIIFTDANTTVQNNANIKLAGAADFTSTADDTLMLVYDGSVWREVSRSVN